MTHHDSLTHIGGNLHLRGHTTLNTARPSTRFLGKIMTIDEGRVEDLHSFFVFKHTD